MKSILVLIFCCSATFTFSQNDSTKHLVNIWRMTPESIAPAAKSRHEQIKKDNPAMASQVTVDVLKDMMGQSTFEYTADGKYIVSTPQGDQESTWKLAEDKVTIITFIPAMGKEIKWRIVRISPSQLVLQSLDNNSLVTYARK